MPPAATNLDKAAGAIKGFRGTTPGANGKYNGAAVWQPVAIGGVAVASWPMLAVGGTVMIFDIAAQREQRAHQKRVAASLDRLEKHNYDGRISAQSTTDKLLSRAIGQMFDGQNPDLTPVLDGAYDEYHRALQFLTEHRAVLDNLTDENGQADYHKVEEALGGKKEASHFFRNLHLAKSAIAILRKALIADAASHALADPTNPYASLRKHFEAQAHQLDEAETIFAELIEGFSRVELKGRWWRVRSKTVTGFQEYLHAQVNSPAADGDTEVLFLRTASGEILQLLPAHDDDPAAPTDREDPQLPRPPDDDTK